MKFNNDLIIFIHIPRTSGSYIEDSLCKKYNINIKWPESNTLNLYGLYKMNHNHYLTLQHLTLHEMIKYNFINQNINEPYIFTIIRNPYDRFVSIYNHLNKLYSTLDLLLDAVEKIGIEYYPHTGIITENKDFNYKNMTSRLSDIKYFVLPQYYYITNNENYKVNIIKYENIETLNDILKINLKFDKKNTKFVLSENQKTRIYNIYKIDFDTFNFIK
jgi:hypothetical protein